MYAVIRIGKAQPGKAGEVLRLIEDKFVPTISKMPSLISYYLIELEDDQLGTIPILETSEAVEELNREALTFIRENASHLMAGPPIAYTGEVKVHIGK